MDAASFRHRQVGQSLAWIAWAVLGVTVSAISLVELHDATAAATRAAAAPATTTAPTSLLAPKWRTVTREYREAAFNWWGGRNLYAHEGIHGFLYLPQSAILFSPFALLPVPVGEVAWRWFSIALLATAVLRLARLAHPEGRDDYFLLLTLLSIPAGMGSFRNGQMNIPLAALLIHATVDLPARQWWRAAVVLALAVALKPLALVMVLLVGALYWRSMSWRLAAALAALLALPFACAAPGYAWAQYQGCIHKLGVAGAPGRTFESSDLVAVLGAVRANLPEHVLTLLRAVAALGTLGVAWLGLRRWGARGGAILLLTLAVAYLMLFNPRNESNSYILLSPVVAVFAAWALLVERQMVVGGVLIAMELGLGFAREFTGGDGRGLRPALTLALLAWVIYRVATRRAVGGAEGEMEPQMNTDGHR